MLKIFHMIRGLPDPAIDLALASALGTATPQTAEPIVEALLERRRMPAVTALVEQFHRLSPASQASILSRGHLLDAPLRRAVSHRRAEVVSNAVTIIVRGRLWTLAYLVTDALRHGPPELRPDAAKALLTLAQALTPTALTHRERESESREKPTPDQARHVRGAVAEAVIHFAQHQRREALLAALSLFEQRLPGLDNTLADPAHPAVGPLRAMLSSANTTQARGALLPALGFPVLAADAVAGLVRLFQQGDPKDISGGGGGGASGGDALRYHAACLRRAEVRNALRNSERPDRLWPDPRQAASYPPEAQRALPELATILSPSQSLLAQRLASLTALSDEQARLEALRRLTHLQPKSTLSDNINSHIAVFTADRSETIARLATRHLVRVNASNLPRVLAPLCNSPHASVAELAESTLGPIGFARLWDGWDRLTIDQRLALGRAMIKIDRQFHVVLARRLAASDPATVQRALAMVQTLGQAGFFEADLLRLLSHSRPRIAATAVRAVGRLQTPAATKAIKQALDHPDARVRANAIEALASRGEEPLAEQAKRLTQIASGEANRPRANAIHSLLRLVGHPEKQAVAEEELGRMLHDARPEHRRSALWVIESAALVGRVAEVAEMAVADADHQVQARARQTFERMINLLTPQGLAALPGSPEQGAIARIQPDNPAPIKQQGAA